MTKIKRLLLSPVCPVLSIITWAMLFPLIGKFGIGLICYFLKGSISEDILYPGSFLTSVGIPFPALILLAVIVIPLAEEFFFRFVLYKKTFKELFSLPPLVAGIMSSFFFAIYHFNVYQGMYAMMAGMYMAFIYQRKGSIRYPLMFHIIANGWALLIEVFIRATGYVAC